MSISNQHGTPRLSTRTVDLIIKRLSASFRSRMVRRSTLNAVLIRPAKPRTREPEQTHTHNDSPPPPKKRGKKKKKRKIIQVSSTSWSRPTVVQIMGKGDTPSFDLNLVANDRTGANTAVDNAVRAVRVSAGVFVVGDMSSLRRPSKMPRQKCTTSSIELDESYYTHARHATPRHASPRLASPPDDR